MGTLNIDQASARKCTADYCKYTEIAAQGSAVRSYVAFNGETASYSQIPDISL